MTSSGLDALWCSKKSTALQRFLNENSGVSVSSEYSPFQVLHARRAAIANVNEYHYPQVTRPELSRVKPRLKYVVSIDRPFVFRFPFFPFLPLFHSPFPPPPWCWCLSHAGVSRRPTCGRHQHPFFSHLRMTLGLGLKIES